MGTKLNHIDCNIWFHIIYLLLVEVSFFLILVLKAVIPALGLSH